MTNWRDEPVVPDVYEVGALVPLARRARNRTVEFDWVFSPGDLRRLRRAVYEWGSTVAGRYRCFDSRILAAINDALGEAAFALNEPKGGSQVNCEVSCTNEQALFRLRGHAPFDVVFGYGAGAVSPQWGVYLGPAVQQTLANSVAMLGWDIRRLQEEAYRPVRNVLYGFPPAHNTKQPEQRNAPAQDVTTHFRGPFAAVDDTECRCLFTEGVAAQQGVYLWTLKVHGKELPWYVGQTRRGFGQRMAEHIACYLSGQYTLWDAEALSDGRYLRPPGIGGGGEWPSNLPSLLRNYHTAVPNIIALITLLRFHVAPMKVTPHVLNRIEGAIGRHFKFHPDQELREFFMPGIKLPAAIPYDSPMQLLLSSDALLVGLPPELRDG